MKVSEASGAALDWMVAKCEGYALQLDDEVSGPWLVPQDGYLHDEKPLSAFRPSTNWAQGGPIIERHIFRLSDYDDPEDPGRWRAEGGDGAEQYGPTPLIAAMRCYVASKLGDEVEIPKELTTN